jgi:hypothetical protein
VSFKERVEGGDTARFLLADYPRWALESRPLVLPGAKARYGAAGVARHIERLGLAAEVEQHGNLTRCKLEWKFPAARAKKAKVSILIPYRDHVDMTLERVNAIRKHTKGVGYEIILLGELVNYVDSIAVLCGAGKY